MVEAIAYAELHDDVANSGWGELVARRAHQTSRTFVFGIKNSVCVVTKISICNLVFLKNHLDVVAGVVLV